MICHQSVIHLHNSSFWWLELYVLTVLWKIYVQPLWRHTTKKDTQYSMLQYVSLVFVANDFKAKWAEIKGINILRLKYV